MVGASILTVVTMTPSPAPRRGRPHGQRALGMLDILPVMNDGDSLYRTAMPDRISLR
jgi:hypothetical protein